jgi:hypothetical protein
MVSWTRLIVTLHANWLFCYACLPLTKCPIVRTDYNILPLKIKVTEAKLNILWIRTIELNVRILLHENSTDPISEIWRGGGGGGESRIKSDRELNHTKLRLVPKTWRSWLVPYVQKSPECPREYRSSKSSAHARTHTQISNTYSFFTATLIREGASV